MIFPLSGIRKEAGALNSLFQGLKTLGKNVRHGIGYAKLGGKRLLRPTIDKMFMPTQSGERTVAKLTGSVSPKSTRARALGDELTNVRGYNDALQGIVSENSIMSILQRNPHLREGGSVYIPKTKTLALHPNDLKRGRIGNSIPVLGQGSETFTLPTRLAKPGEDFVIPEKTQRALRRGYDVSYPGAKITVRPSHVKQPPLEREIYEPELLYLSGKQRKL